MALIQCPECGKTVSNKAETCIHCGVKLTVCPECGTALAGAVEICPACGYRLSVASAPTKSLNKEEVAGKPQKKDGKKPSDFTTRLWGIGLAISISVIIAFIVGIIIVSVYYYGVGYTPMQASQKGATIWRIAAVAGIAAVVLMFIGRMDKAAHATERKAGEIVLCIIRFAIGLIFYTAVVFGGMEGVFAFSLWTLEVDTKVVFKVLLIFAGNLSVALLGFHEIIIGVIAVAIEENSLRRKKKAQNKDAHLSEN